MPTAYVNKIIFIPRNTNLQTENNFSRTNKLVPRGFLSHTRAHAPTHTNRHILTDRWMVDGWTDGRWTEGCTYERTDGIIDGCSDGQTEGWTEGYIDIWLNR